MDDAGGAVGVWKFLTGIATTALITLMLAYPRDTVNRSDFEQFKREAREQEAQSQRDQEAKNAALAEQVNQLRIETVRIADHLGVPPHGRNN